MENLELEPDYHYVLFTLTFKPIITCALKFRRINNLHKIFNRILNQDAKLLFTIEYHKRKDGSPNRFSPHVHGIYKTKKIHGWQINELEHYFKQNWGREQFILQENIDEIDDYDAYIRKDLVVNNQAVPSVIHGRAFDLSKKLIVKDYDDDF